MDPTERCPHCGTPLPAGALEGLCPACLLRQDSAGDSLPGTADAPEISELSGTFPQLEILELLGRGGMGAVYKARQKHLDRFVALKILPPGVGCDPAFAERFEREAKALAKLQHPHIVTLYEFGKAGELYYFLMEYVDGANLRQVLHGGHLAPPEALAIVPQICDALQFAHDRGIVHRDIKPENILLGKDGLVKIADFGVAKIVGAVARADGSGGSDRSDRSAGDPAVTAPGRVVGTPAYMAPEQRANPGDVDHRADIYSLGVVFYQMLTGELPGKAWEPPSRKVVVDVRLDAVVLRALEQAPDRRYQHVSEVKTIVATIVASPSRSSDSPPRAAARGTGRSWLAFALAFAAHAAFALGSAARLPARVATHFGYAGTANGWMSREGYLLFILALPLAQAGFFWWIGGVIRAVPPRFVSLPRRDYWLSPEHRDEAVTLLRRYLLVYAGFLALFFAGLHVLTLRANAANPPVLEMGGLLLVMMAFLMATILWISLLLVRFAETGGERPHVEGRAPRSPTARAPGATRPSRGLRMAIAAALLLLALVFLPLPGFLLPSLGPRALARRQASLAESPADLRRVTIDRAIGAGLSQPLQPWAWQELERRSLTPADGARIADGITAWLRRELPDGAAQPLSWLDSFLETLSERGLVDETQALGLVEALHGNLRGEPLDRLRQGDVRLDVTAACRYRWRGSLLGLEMLNEVQAAMVDGIPVRFDDAGGRFCRRDDVFVTLRLPALEPGRHRVRLDVLSALVFEGDLPGLAADAPSTEWPPAKKRWTRTLELEFRVFAPDAELVGLEQDPAFDPVAAGGLTVEPIIIRPKGQQSQAVLSFGVTSKLPLSVSFDVALRVAGTTVPCGTLWAAKGADGRMAPRSGETLTLEFPPLDPDVAEADVVLAPNRSLIEHVAAVDRIWGREITFSRVPLKRQDSGAAHDASETEDGTSPGLRPIPPTLMALVRDMEEAEASGKAGTVRQSASVGSVVERTLRYFGDGNGHDVVWLQDGSLSALPTGFFHQGAALNREWLRRRGPGVFPGTGIADGKAAHGLCGGGMVFAVVPNAWWDAPPAATALAEAVARSETVSRPALTTFAIQGGTLYLWPTDTPLPLTLAFQDDRGACGLLQVLAVRDAAGTTPVGGDTYAYAWTVRYRLAQSPGVTVLSDPTEVAVPRQESRLQFRLVAEERDPAFWEPLPCAPALNQQVLGVCTEVLLDESSVAAANVEPSPAGDPQVTLQLSATGKEAFARVTQNSVGKRLAIVLDGLVLSAPVVRTAITGGSAIISGAMTREDAETIAAQIRRAAEATAETAQRQRRQNDMRQILIGATLYAAENRGEWPATLSALAPYLHADTAAPARWDAEFAYRRPGHAATVNEGGVERIIHPPVLCEKQPVDASGLLVAFADGRVEFVVHPEHLRQIHAAFAPPVIVECTVNDLDDGRGQQALSLTQGQVLTLPPDFGRWTDPQRQAWLHGQSIDLLVEQVGNRWAFMGLGISFGDLANEHWEQATVADAGAALAVGSRLLERIEDREGVFHALPVGANPPLAFAFRTRTGALGVLQITGFSDAPQAMRLRYKLLRGSATPPAAPSSDTPPAPVKEIAKPLNPASPPEPRTSARQTHE